MAHGWKESDLKRQKMTSVIHRRSYWQQWCIFPRSVRWPSTLHNALLGRSMKVQILVGTEKIS